MSGKPLPPPPPPLVRPKPPPVDPSAGRIPPVPVRGWFPMFMVGDEARVAHAVPLKTWPALCGDEPKAGWLWERGLEVTCPRCWQKIWEQELETASKAQAPLDQRRHPDVEDHGARENKDSRGRQQAQADCGSNAAKGQHARCEAGGGATMEEVDTKAVVMKR
jgi:hypothetical protein